MTDAKPKNALAEAIAKIAGQLTVEKEQISAGSGGTYKAFTVDRVFAAVKPLLADAGIAVYPQPPIVTYAESARSGGGIMTTAQYHGIWLLVHAKSGDQQLIGFQADARDTGDKAPIQAGQQAFKYALVQLFQIGAGDPEAEQPPEPAIDKEQMVKALTNAGRQHLFDLSDKDKELAQERWPLVLTKAGLSEVTTLEERDLVIQTATDLYAEGEDEAEDEDPSEGYQ